MSQKYLPSTSRDLNPTNYAWDSVVYQAARPMLDSELNLTQDILNKKNTLPSGMISYQGQDESIGSFAFQAPSDPSFSANAFVINPFKAMVNGMVIDVRNTDATDGTNKITLPAPDQGGGAGNRGDFVFLEVWRREVTPAMQSKSRIKVISPLAGDELTFQKGGNSVVLTAGTEYQTGLSVPETTRNIAQAINDYDGVNLGLTVDGITTFAETRGTEYLFLNHNGGASGNHSGGASFTIASSDPSGIRILNQPAGGSDGEGKPDANNIYFAGNVLSPTGSWLPDYIQDPNVNVSSTRRIQIQYRIRSQQNLNLSDFIFGFENGMLLARGSKSQGVNQKNFIKHPTDNGLWYAGDGSEADATALGTVDGYVYALPLCYVFRRNAMDNANNGFNPLNSFNTGALHNHNGALNDNDYVGQVNASDSDRPDGLFADQIAEPDVLDLRRRVYPRGIDFSAELEYQYHSLLDNTNKTWFAKAHFLQETGNDTGGASHSPLVCDVYGRNENANIQNVGEWRSEFDHVARRWSNEPTTERIYIVAKPQQVAQVSTGVTVVAGGGTGNFWYAGDQITIDLGSMDASGNLLWSSLRNSPYAGVGKLIDIGYCWHNDGHYVTAIEQQVRIQKVEGLGTDSGAITITLEANPITANGGLQAGDNYFLVGDANSGESDTPNANGTGSNKEIFIELIFDYSSTDRGLSGTVAEAPIPDDSGYPTGSAVLIENHPDNAVNIYPTKGNGNAPPISNVMLNTKEVSLEYVHTSTDRDYVSNGPLSTYLPWRLYYNPDVAGVQPSITDISGAGAILSLDNANTNYQHAESKLSWTSGGGWAGGQRLVRVSSGYPLEPYPADNVTDSTILVYYRRNAPKTVGADFPIASAINKNNGGHVPDELNLQPLAVGKEVSVYLKTTEHYPFFNPTDEFATHTNAESNSYSEYKVLGSPEVILDDLKINTGSVSLPSFVPFVSSVNLTLGDTSPSQPPRKDAEGRVYYPTMEDTSYFPSAFAKNMGGYHSHYKTTLPCLMKVVDDNHDLYRKGEVLLVVFVKTNVWGQGVAVDMRETLSDNYVAACVYRTRNQLLLGE